MTRFQVALALVSCLVLDNGMRWGEAAQRWQWQDAVAILDEAGVRYHLLTRPRGGSKTTDLGAILIAVMLAQVRDGARLYTLAADRDQGRLILSAMRGFVVRTPILEGALVFSGHRVSVPGRDIVLEVLAADAASSCRTMSANVSGRPMRSASCARALGVARYSLSQRSRRLES